MDIKQKVGHAVREFREKKKVTQKKLAELTGIDRTFISHIEGGERNVSIETLETVLNGLDISLQKFFNHEIFRNSKEKRN